MGVWNDWTFQRALGSSADLPASTDASWPRDRFLKAEETD